MPFALKVNVTMFILMKTVKFICRGRPEGMENVETYRDRQGHTRTDRNIQGQTGTSRDKHGQTGTRHSKFPKLYTTLFGVKKKIYANFYKIL